MRKVYGVLLAFMMLITPSMSFADFFVSINIVPPALPVYEQPEAPAPDYIWVPGYWAYDSFFEDYYWIPGTWVPAPAPGLLWTPGYWYWRDGRYIYSEGYWGHHVGFYGGIHYGFGYGGVGFSGGRWNGGVFVHNTVNVTNVTNNTISFNGGSGGTHAQPTPQERAAMKEKHYPVTDQQKRQVQAARSNPALRASANHGKPAIAATSRPGVFKGKGVVGAKKAGNFYNRTKSIKSKAAGSRSNSGIATVKHTTLVRHHEVPLHHQSRPTIKRPVRRPPPHKVAPKSDKKDNGG